MNEQNKTNSKKDITNVIIGLSLGIVGTLALSSETTRVKIKDVVKNKSKEIANKCKTKSFNNKDTSENYIEIKPTYKQNKEDLE